MKNELHPVLFNALLALDAVVWINVLIQLIRS